MKYLLFITLLLPVVMAGQHTKEEVIEILGVFHLTDLINEQGLIYLTAEVERSSEFPFPTLVPTMGKLERNRTGGYYSAQIIEMLKDVYAFETQYRMGTFFQSPMQRDLGINNSQDLTEIQQDSISKEWQKKMMNHPGYLVELALGEDLLDTLRSKNIRPATYYFTGGRIDWNNYQMMVPEITSVFAKTTPRILQLLINLELITKDIFQHWKTDMETNGYFSPMYVLGALAREMGEVETKDSRIKANREFLDQLVAAELMSTENQKRIVSTDSVLASSEIGSFLPFLNNTRRIDFPATGTIEEGYKMLLSTMEQIDSKLGGISFSLQQIPRPEGKDSTGEYYSISLIGLGQSAKTVIHANKDSGDKPGQAPRMLFLPNYLKIIDELFEKANYPERIYTSSLWQKLDEAKILPVYVSLIDPSLDSLIKSHYSQLNLSGNSRK